MGTRTRTGVVPVVLIVAVAAVVFGGDRVLDVGRSAVGEIGDRMSDEYAVAAGAERIVEQCTADQVLRDKECGDYKVLVINARKMPYIARNIHLAWADGQPFILHRDKPGSRLPKYRVTCSRAKFTALYPKGSCDEYPFASSTEGGAGARTEEVHSDEQNCQDGTISSAYQRVPIEVGDAYLVVIAQPGHIATEPWQGEGVKTGLC